MTATVLSFPQPRHYLRAVPPDAAPAEIISFTEHLPVRERADQTCRQADLILARSVALYVQGFLLAFQFGLLGLHVHQRGVSTCPKKHDRQAEFIGKNSVRTIPPEPA